MLSAFEKVFITSIKDLSKTYLRSFTEQKTKERETPFLVYNLK